MFNPPGNDLGLPDHMRGLLSKALGPVMSLDGALEHCKGKTVSCVGDVVTRDFTDAGVTPKLAAVDGKTRRNKDGPPLPESGFDRTAEVDNPPGTITAASWKAIEEAYSQTGSTLLRVKGEEDLLSIPSIILGPEGGVVVYGVPGEGVGVNDINIENRNKCIRIIEQMEAV